MLKEIPLLSICIPTYNRVSCLTQCLESITSQIDADAPGIVEIAIIDNASTDNTKDVVLAYCQKYGYISYFCNNTNIGAERNIYEAAKRAKREYVWIFGDDDLLPEQALQRIIPLLKKDAFDFIMINKTIKSADMSEIIVKNRNPANDDESFPDIRDLCCEFGFLTNLGFISTAIFRRKTFLAVDAEPYLELKMEYGYAAVLLEAFADRPCYYVSDVLISRRFVISNELARVGLFIHTLGIIRMFRVLLKKGIIDYPFIERIKEKPLFRTNPTLLHEMIWALGRITGRKSLITRADWTDIFEFLSHFENGEFKQQARQIYAEYISRLTIERITGEARTTFLDRALETGVTDPDAHKLALDEESVAILGQWITQDTRVNKLKEYWNNPPIVKENPIDNSEAAIKEPPKPKLKTEPKFDGLVSLYHSAVPDLLKPCIRPFGVFLVRSLIYIVRGYRWCNKKISG